MNLLHAITRDVFRTYIKAAYAKRASLKGSMVPVEELSDRFMSLFGVENTIIGTELFVFDGRYTLIAAPVERRDIEDMADIIYATPGVVWLYLLDITGELPDGGLADYRAKPLDREFPEVQALLC